MRGGTDPGLVWPADMPEFRTAALEHYSLMMEVSYLCLAAIARGQPNLSLRISDEIMKIFFFFFPLFGLTQLSNGHRGVEADD
jgi:hypothetical protein